MARQLTDKAVREAKKRANRYSLSGSLGSGMPGRLVCDIAPTGTKTFYYRYRSGGQDKLIKVGRYGADGGTGALTLAQASEQARLLSERLKTTSDLKEALELDRRRDQEERRVKLAAARAADLNTLRALLDEYVKHLETAGKQSARDARNVFDNHVLKSNLAERPAATITSREITELVRRVSDAGKSRTAGKLRSFLHAAYALAVRAEHDPTASSTFVGFRIELNPVTPVAAGALAERVQPRDRALSAKELKAYMARLLGLPSMTGGALWLALLLGGQRPAQVLRLRLADVDLVGGTVRLFDPKGKRKQPRPHVLSLTVEARAVVSPIIAAREKLDDPGEWVFSSDLGKTAMRIETLSAAVHGIVTAMKEAKETREHFQMRDVRRTCETMLAAIGISKDIRAQILSHGLGGVQDRHYDRHEYMDEKRLALESWAAKLKEIAEDREPSPKVVPTTTAKVA
jgi:integrase